MTDEATEDNAVARDMHDQLDRRVADALEEYLAARDAGAELPRAQLLAQYADVADELSECLDALDFVNAATLENAGALAPTTGEPPEDLQRTPLGDFRLVREIGRGGMGVVYEAVQLSLGRRVAVKVLPFVASLDPTRLQRFKLEAQAAAQLHHTNIVPVYAVGNQRGVHYYAMQLIQGHALSALLDDLRRVERQEARSAADAGLTLHEAPSRSQHDTSSHAAPMPQASGAALPIAGIETHAATSTVLTDNRANSQNYFRTVARLLAQAAEALEHAHRFGVIHRDIKPANLLLDDLGNLWITDFGLAQFHAEAQLTQTGDLVGTLRYMSPEQVEGDRVVLDHRTDIYSLGATLYELLTLEPAFSGADRAVLIGRIQGDEPRAPRSVDRRIPIELETIVLKSMAKAPRERYATAQQFADDLHRWLEDKPILARRPTLIEHAARWQRRHRSLVASAVGFLLLAMLLLFATTLLISREHSKTKAAYQREIAHREAAEESFRQARNAVDTFLQLEEDELANRPSMHQLRRKFLQVALDYYGNFVEQRREDPSLQAELAAASQRVAQIADEVSVLSRFAPLTLLSDPRVQQDLKLPSPAGEQIAEALNELYEDWKDYTPPNSDSSPSTSRQQQLVELLRERERYILNFLSAPQVERLQQVAWQQRKHIAFKHPEIAERLKLTPAQRQAINDVIDSERPGGFPPGGAPGPSGRRDPGGGPPRTEMDPRGRDGMARGRMPPPPEPGNSERTMRRILAILTAEQLAVWQATIGEPFLHDLHWGPDEWMPR